MSNLWRPFSVPGADSKLQISKGDGAFVSDFHGRQYLDAISGLWNTSLGQKNKLLIDEINRQFSELSYASLFDSTHIAAELLCDRLISEFAFYDIKHVYFSTTGSSAVEVALRAARLHFRSLGKLKKRRILSFDLGYHGSTSMSLSASGIFSDAAKEFGEILPDFQHIPSPKNEKLSLKALSDILESDRDSIAALIVEPILGSGGIIIPSKGYCEEVSRLCRAHDVILIADEVATGGGRCGELTVSQVLGYQPEIITLSKGINSGYFPVGLTLFAHRVTDPIIQGQIPFQYGSTQDGNPIGCISVLATLNIIRDHKLMDRAIILGDRIKTTLSEIVPNSVLKEIRGVGLMIGLEFAHMDKFRSPFSVMEIRQVQDLCKEAGLLVYTFDSGLSLFPPLTFSDEDVTDLIEILVEIIQRVF